MNNKTICVALVGIGWAGRMHARAYNHVYGIDVRRKTVCGLEENLSEFAQQFRFESCTRDFGEILRDPEVDLIDITTC